MNLYGIYREATQQFPIHDHPESGSHPQVTKDSTPTFSHTPTLEVLGPREGRDSQAGNRLSAEGTAGLALGASRGVISSLSRGGSGSVGVNRGGGSSAGGSRGSRGRGGRAGAGARRAGGAADDEVDTADVGLVDGAGVPPPLEGAATLLGAGGGEVRGDSDGEVLVAVLDARLGGGV